MFRVIGSAFALAAPGSFAFVDQGIEDEDALQLLQVAAKRHNHTQKSDGYCEGLGDIHIQSTFYGRAPDPQDNGLYNWASSKDGRFRSQVYQCGTPFPEAMSWVNAMAYEIDGTRIQILPPSTIVEKGPVYIRADGKEYSSDQIPFTIPGTTIEFRAHKPPYLFHIVTEGLDASIEMVCGYWRHIKFCYMNAATTISPDNVPDPESNEICTIGSGATQVADDTMETDWSVSLFSNDDHDRICDFCLQHFQDGSAKNKKCAKPPPKPPAPPAKTECEENGCSWTHSQQLCHSLQEDEVLYNDCLFDFCVECNDDAAIQFVEEEEDQHPKPTCVEGAAECDPDEVCETAVTMNTLSVAQNNLGGVGPDSGAEEIRYSNAAVVNGQKVDLVLTTDGTFKTGTAAKNGQSGAFGNLNVKCGTSVTLNMRVVDSTTGAPVTLDAVALTWYDLDEGKKQKGRATVTSCGSTGAIISQNTELTHKREGDCQSFTSSVPGNGKDNPRSPHQLDSIQISRAVTLPFKGVSEFSSTLSLSKAYGARNFLFSLEPSVACGLKRPE